MRQWAMIELRKRIAAGVKNPEIAGDIHFEEWLEVLYKPGLCGLDYADVADAVKGKTATLKCAEFDNIVDLKSTLGKMLDFNSKSVVMAIKIPNKEDGLSMVKEISETLAASVNTEAMLLWQANKNSRKTIKIVVVELN